MSSSSSTPNTTQSWPVRSFEECEKMVTGPGMPFETESMVIKGRPVKVYKMLHNSLRDFWLASKPFADKDYIVYETERVTYGEAFKQVATLANALQKRGIGKGDRVVIAMRNFPEYIISFWAIASLGAIAACVNAWSPREVLLHCITKTGAKLCIVDSERATVLGKEGAQVLRDNGLTSAILVVKESKVEAGFESYEAVMRSHATEEYPEVDIHPEDVAVIFFTSGTTSMPKGVFSTQRQYLTNRPNTSLAALRAALRRGEPFPVPDPNLPQKGLLLSVPLFHVTGNQSFLALLTSVGGKICLMRKWDKDVAVDLIRNEKLTAAGGVPFMVMELIDSDLKNGGHSLEGISFGGAAPSDRLPTEIQKNLPAVNVGQAFGLTETNAIAVSHAGEDYLLRPKSCGVATPVTEIKIIDPETGVTLGEHQTGEILVRGPHVAEGYWMDEKATKEAFLEGGWFRSGDLGHLDQDGFLFISDRAKEIIIRGGENISTISVENALYADDRVKDAAVVPVPDDRFGELVAAVVVAKPGFEGKITEKELIDLVSKQLPKHCVPVMIHFRAEMPRNPSGKTLKKELKKECGEIWEKLQTKKKEVSKAKL